MDKGALTLASLIVEVLVYTVNWGVSLAVMQFGGAVVGFILRRLRPSARQ